LKPLKQVNNIGNRSWSKSSQLMPPFIPDAVCKLHGVRFLYCVILDHTCAGITSTAAKGRAS
jgi:hypothetical protein